MLTNVMILEFTPSYLYKNFKIRLNEKISCTLVYDIRYDIIFTKELHVIRAHGDHANLRAGITYRKLLFHG